MRLLIILLSFIGCRLAFAQPTVPDASIPSSENGWYLSPHGTIRVLVLFAEIEYDKNPAQNPANDQAEHWPKGQLPKWKDDLFDPFSEPTPVARVSRYYHDISLGHYIVLGDYVDHMLTLKESEYPEVKNAHSISTAAVKEANKLGELRTRHKLKIEDFDLWQDGGKAGLPKVNKPDEPHRYDHVMVIARNSGLTHGQGSTDQGSPGKLFGYESDTQSRFGGMNGSPFEILKHEFNHLLLGGNNFHSGGGNAAQFESCFIALQGGWSMMGAASSSLLTCTGWDRYRLGWKAPGAASEIMALDAAGHPISGDLDPTAGDTGTFLLRDFMTTGDVLRIKLPHLDADEMPQWIWLENHLGSARNGCPTDLFHYEREQDCVQGIRSGIFAQLQCGREQKQGERIFEGPADYLRAMPAGGFTDMYPRGDTVQYGCMWGGRTQPVIIDGKLADPFCGGSELEFPPLDQNGDGLVDRAKEGLSVRIDVRDGVAHEHHRFLGHGDQAFTAAGNNKLGMATNPALVNMLTLISTPKKDKLKRGRPNDRVIHLAGLSVTILEQRADGTAVLRVRADDVTVDRDVRWCADSIVLHPGRGPDGVALRLSPRRTIRLDRSRTPTRIDAPEHVDGTDWFSAPTSFALLPGATVLLERRSTLTLVERSRLHVMPGARLELARGARLNVDRGCTVVLHGDGQVTGNRKRVERLEKKGRLVHMP